jgi:hypothetical protein
LARLVSRLIAAGVLAGVQSLPWSDQVEDRNDGSNDPKEEPPAYHAGDPEGLRPGCEHRRRTSGHVDDSPDNYRERRVGDEKRKPVAHTSSFQRSADCSSERDCQSSCRTFEEYQKSVRISSKRHADAETRADRLAIPRRRVGGSLISMVGHESAASLGKRIGALALTPVVLVATLGVGWLAWSVLEWRNGRTPSYRLIGLRVVRIQDEKPSGFVRSLVRSCICGLLVVPTIAVGCVVGVCFVFGASPPDDLFRPRRAPWDHLTATMVIDERPTSGVHGSVPSENLGPLDTTAYPRPGIQGNGRAH